MSNHSCCARQRVKRGLWSPEEDEKLVNYVTTHGHGCWSTVPRLAGLQRCGKSCRLRWINYLRPDLKRGNFTSQEAALIIELHRVIGNRWAQIARRLPGRTDNEVKNFWNANIKRKLLQAHHHNLISNSDPTALINNNINMSTNYMNNNNNNPNPSSSSQFIHHHQLPPPTFMNYDSALTPPSFDPLLPPLPLSCTYENPINIPDQNYYQPFVPNDDNLSFGQVSSNNNIDDKDLDLLEALMPEFRNMSEAIGIDFPLTTDEGVQQQLDVLDPTAGNSSFDPALHPTHIKNIASLMATFAPPGSIPPEPWDVPFPESPSFTAASSSWGPHP